MPFVNPLPGVPNVESPFFAKIFADAAIDGETLRIASDLNANGYAVLDFPDDGFARMAEEIKRNLHDRYDWEAWRNGGYASGQGLRLIDAHRFDENVRRIAVNQRIIDLLSLLFGRQAWPFQTLNFPVSTQQHFHTDSIHFSSAPERFMCGVWTALEDIDDDAGPLLYFPGSHTWPIYTNEHIGLCSAETEHHTLGQHTFEPMWQALIEAHGAKPQSFAAKKGQCLIWLANLLHGGNRQKDPTKTRWSQVTHYYFEDCAYYSPMFSDPFYGNIAFRELPNLVDGKIMHNRYAGRAINPEFIHSVRSVPVQTRQLPIGFDAKRYLDANPDVKRSGVPAADHYLSHGWKEQRSLG